MAHPDAPSDHAKYYDGDGDGEPHPRYDRRYDCFRFVPRPDWGGAAPGEGWNPRVDRDDTDGGGPEVISFAEPQPGRAYRIGVHYWSDHEYGASFATVRVFAYGELVYEESGVRLTNHDVWFVGTVDWPSGAVIPARTPEGGRRITPDYQNPEFFQP